MDRPSRAPETPSIAAPPRGESGPAGPWGLYPRPMLSRRGESVDPTDPVAASKLNVDKRSEPGFQLPPSCVEGRGLRGNAVPPCGEECASDTCT